MSVRYEGLTATQTHVEFVPAGTEVGQDVVADGAIILSYDEVVYIEGTPAELRAFAEEILDALPKKDARPEVAPKIAMACEGGGTEFTVYASPATLRGVADALEERGSVFHDAWAEDVSEPCTVTFTGEINEEG